MTRVIATLSPGPPPVTPTSTSSRGWSTPPRMSSGTLALIRSQFTGPSSRGSSPRPELARVAGSTRTPSASVAAQGVGSRPLARARKCFKDPATAAVILRTWSNAPSSVNTGAPGPFGGPLLAARFSLNDRSMSLTSLETAVLTRLLLDEGPRRSSSPSESPPSSADCVRWR
jgi:hypothetical protein